MMIPRLSKGQGVKGAEPYGCFNTGVAWCIFRSPVTGEYLVARQLDLDALRTKVLFHGYDGQRKFKLSHGPAWRFKTRKPAVAKFTAMNNEQLTKNRRESLHVAMLKAKSQQGDVGATLTLGLDYGVR